MKISPFEEFGCDFNRIYQSISKGDVDAAKDIFWWFYKADFEFFNYIQVLRAGKVIKKNQIYLETRKPEGSNIYHRAIFYHGNLRMVANYYNNLFQSLAIYTLDKNTVDCSMFVDLRGNVHVITSDKEPIKLEGL